MNKVYKNIKLATAALVLTLGLASCSSDYLETQPTDSASQTLVLSTADNLMAVINGMHRNMYSRQVSSQGANGQGGINIILDVMGDDVIFPTTGNGWYVSSLRWQDGTNENGTNDLYPYQFYYQQIRNANLVIMNGDAATGDASTKNMAIGEALAYRAYSYFYLVQFYGKRFDATGTNDNPGVPLRLDDSTTPLARATVAQVYAQINSDLQAALKRVSGLARNTKSHFNTGVINGLLARVALTQGNYVDAAKYANAARSGYSLMDATTYAAGFNDLSNGEWMWGSNVTNDQTDYFGNFGAYMSRNYNSTQIRQAPKVMSKKLYDQFAKTDVRTQVVDPTGLHLPWFSMADPKNPGKYIRTNAYSAYALATYTSQKFMVKDQNNAIMDVPLMRASEMYLIEAEALARMSPANEAQSKVVFNTLAKMRNPSYAGATTTGQAYLDELMANRRLELWGEGFRFLDLKRLNQGLDRSGSNQVDVVINGVVTVPNTDNRWQWLIPRSELNANPLVTQNPL